MSKRFLTPAEVPAVLLRAFPDYRGRTFAAVVGATVTLDGAFWSGGSRSTYLGLELATGRVATAAAAATNPPQFGGLPQTAVVELAQGWAVVEHIIHCGKDHGLVFHVRPDCVAALLPAPAVVELSPAALVVLYVTCSLKAHARRSEAAHHGVNGGAYDSALAELKALGYVDPRGAATVAGRNVGAREPRQRVLS